jgi:hypothetical protein
MLPGYVDLLMQITTNLRTRSTRAKGDDHAIRGLLQLLGELFREQKLGERQLGALVTLDSIYEVQHSALDADLQNTLTRLLNHEEVINNFLAIKVAKTVALLELIQEQEPTTATFVSQCLYSELGQGNQEPNITQALEKLRNLGLLSYSDKFGYKIQSSAGQEWQRERDAYSVISDALSQIVAEKLKTLLGSVERPRYKNKAFPWVAFFSDGRQRQDERLQGLNDPAVLIVDFRYLSNPEDRNSSTWIQNSDSANLRDRIIWVVGKLSDLVVQARDLGRSRHIVNKYESRRHSLSGEKQRLLSEEITRRDNLEKKVQTTIAQAFLDGELYFRGRLIDKQQFGTAFTTVLERVGESILPELYNRYVDVAITPGELTQLLEPNLSGPSQKFMGSELGILELDAGKYIPTCSGEVPSRLAQYIQDQNGIPGNALLAHFGGPPYGYPADVVKACLAGLLRANKVRIRPESGPEITSVRDPGAKDMFTKDRDIKRADLLPPNQTEISARDRIAICKFFKDSLGTDLDRENDAIADAVFQQFPNQVKRLQELEKRYNRLPNRPDLPPALVKLREALEKSMRSRQVEDTVITVKKNLDALRDGIQELGISLTDLSDSGIEVVAKTAKIRDHQVAQLQQIDRIAEVKPAIDALIDHLNCERPWRDINSLKPHLEAIEEHYKAVRLSLIEQQDKQAETIRSRIKQRQGFIKLNEKQGDYVLRPIHKAVPDTTQDSLYPSLLELRDSAILRLQTAEQEANTYLDNTLSQVTDEQVIQLQLNLSGREVSTPEEIEALANQLKERLLAQLKPNTRIRII